MRALGKISAPRRLTSSGLYLPSRQYNFASESYAKAFGNLPAFDSKSLRAESVLYMKRSEGSRVWYLDPIQTVLNGKVMKGGKHVLTYNAFNEENGLMIHSTNEIIDQVISHMQNYKPTELDLRAKCRIIEQELLTTYAPALVGNQALDFKKQDGITEIEESVEANTVERRLNDLLLSDEKAGKIKINRNAALCGCVSNFSNFLDLFRKTLRNLELGVPVVVLSRSNTAQHCYRWFQILSSLLAKHGIDAGMLTHASCDVAQQRRIMSANPSSPLYFTGSRVVSAAIKEVCPMLMSSTGGPNTMVTDSWTPAVAGALRMSAAIENSGQCTALRHLVAPGINATEIQNAFNETKVITTSSEALSAGEFAAVFKAQPFSVDPGYQKHPTLPVAFKITSGELPPDDLDEKWRQVYVDVTSTKNVEELRDPAFLSRIAAWLVKHQPISLAVNGSDFDKSFALMEPLFEQSAMPALTAQARPQDAEIFGEFPPRHQLSTYTKFPVVGPSSTPGYDAAYTDDFLVQQASATSPKGLSYADTFIEHVKDARVRGYLRVNLAYLSEAACGPREGHGKKRTSLWGLQRPPLGAHGATVLRAALSTSFDDLSVPLLPFVVTNARSQVTVSVHPQNAAVLNALHAVNAVLPSQDQVKIVAQTDQEFEFAKRIQAPWNVVVPGKCEFALVGHYISLLFPLGHIKCTRSNDRQFVNYFKSSPKWLWTLSL